MMSDPADTPHDVVDAPHDIVPFNTYHAPHDDCEAEHCDWTLDQASPLELEAMHHLCANPDEWIAHLRATYPDATEHEINHKIITRINHEIAAFPDGFQKREENVFGTIPSASLDEVKKDYAIRIDADAEQRRLKYITPGDGMQMVYREKFEQASSVHSLGRDVADAMQADERDAAYPVLSASVGLEGDTLWECAEIVLKKYTQFAQLSLVIERTRLTGKKNIQEARDIASAKAAYEAVTWTV
jgi:hypothetical protein